MKNVNQSIIRIFLLIGLFCLFQISVLAQKCKCKTAISTSGYQYLDCPCIVKHKPDCNCIYLIPPRKQYDSSNYEVTGMWGVKSSGERFVTKEYSSFCYDKKHLITSGFNSIWDVDSLIKNYINGDTIEVIKIHFVLPFSFKPHLSNKANDSIRIATNDVRWNSDTAFRNRLINRYGYYDTVRDTWKIIRSNGLIYAYKVLPSGNLSYKINIKQWNRYSIGFPIELKNLVYYFMTNRNPNDMVMYNGKYLYPKEFINDDGTTIFDRKK